MNQIIYLPIQSVIDLFEGIGKYFLLMIKIFRSYRTWNIYFSFIIDQMYLIGTNSIPIVIFTSMFSGMVSSINAAYQLETGLVPTWYIGGIVGEAILLELAPMITGLVMTGRIGATITAEIGTMRVSEQIDALEMLSFDPVSFLIMPRIFAAAVMFPVLVVLADFFGIIGGLIAAINSIDVSVYEFLRGLKSWYRPWDAWFGVIKGFFFGIAITSIACYKGFYTEGGAHGVGKATTSTVVISCVVIILLDFLLGGLLL